MMHEVVVPNSDAKAKGPAVKKNCLSHQRHKKESSEETEIADTERGES